MAKWRMEFEVTGTAYVVLEMEGPYRRKAAEAAQKEVENTHIYPDEWEELDYNLTACEFVPTEDCPEEPAEPVEFYLRRIKAAALPGFEGLVYGGKQ